MTSMPQAVAQLVERFSHNFKAYHRSDYNETQVRVQFIDPLFEALGWDVLNRRGVAPRYQDVVHEAALHDRGGTKAPDYSFRIGSERKFFVEAKKPAVDIRGDTHPAYQLRRYGWTAKLCLSVLTDFEEFSVYDSSRGMLPAWCEGQDCPEHRFLWDCMTHRCSLRGLLHRTGFVLEEAAKLDRGISAHSTVGKLCEERNVRSQETG